MSSTSNYSPSLSCIPGRNVSLTNLKVCDSASVNGDLTVEGDLTVTTINGDPYFPVPPPVASRVLITTSDTTPQVEWGELPPATIENGANLTTLRSRGGATVWDPPDLDILPPGSNNQILNTINGAVGWRAFLLSQIPPGANNQVITTVGGVTSWATPSTPRVIRYGTFLAAQNLNSIAGPNPVTFSTAAFTSISAGGVSNFSQPSTTQFLCGFTATYDINLNGFFDPSSTGIPDAVVTLSAEVAGVELTRTCVTTYGNAFSGTIPSVAMTAGTNLRILARRVTGAGSLNTYTTPTIIPNFTSTITLSLVNTVG